MGAAGDMLTAALYELLPEEDRAKYIASINSLGIPRVKISAEESMRCGVKGTHISVLTDGMEEKSEDVLPGARSSHTHEPDTHTHADDSKHHHTSMNEIAKIIESLAVSDKVKADALAIYGILAEAEQKVHGMDGESIHFDEVGMPDAITDITGVCILMEEIAPDKVIVSPINTGSGQVKTAHGILPVPAPATALILQDIPTYSTDIKGELCTPTGAALLKYFANGFGPKPAMTVDAIGYGMGMKNFPAANCVRAFIGNTEIQKQSDIDHHTEPNDRHPELVSGSLTTGHANVITEIACNIDDMTGEELGFALNTLMDSGALDAYIIPIQGKKSRPAYILTCLCRPEDELKFSGLILKHTSTFGVRYRAWNRHILERESYTIETEYGEFRIKRGHGFGVEKSKPEADDLEGLARAQDISVIEAKKFLQIESEPSSSVIASVAKQSMDE
jgi:uncharacterized protein (TIGR00299 family) protein